MPKLGLGGQALELELPAGDVDELFEMIDRDVAGSLEPQLVQHGSDQHRGGAAPELQHDFRPQAFQIAHDFSREKAVDGPSSKEDGVLERKCRNHTLHEHGFLMRLEQQSCVRTILFGEVVHSALKLTLLL